MAQAARRYIDVCSGDADVVSARAPLAAAGGARERRRRFGGAGRTGAADIDHLPAPVPALA